MQKHDLVHQPDVKPVVKPVVTHPITSIQFWTMFLLLLAMFGAADGTAQDAGQNLDFDGQFFFSYDHTTSNGEQSDEFSLKRGYITFRRAITDRFSIRFTQDISIDEEGDGAGDIELRLKYALLKMSLDDLGPLKNPSLDIGVVHRPWIDFEQDINDYRAQKPMFLDQNDILSSADYGFSFSALLGEPLDATARRGMRTPPGTYGSIDIGLYNGGGYSALEANRNKLIEARIALRPLPRRLPGLQVSGFTAIGDGNNEFNSDFHLFGGGLSFESEPWRFLAQTIQSEGDGSGSYINARRQAYSLTGWGLFTELRPFSVPLSLTGRFEYLRNEDLEHTVNRQTILGVAYIFPNRSKFMLDVASVDADPLYGQNDFTRVQFVTEIRF